MPPWLVQVFVEAATTVLREVFIHHGVLPKTPPAP